MAQGGAAAEIASLLRDSISDIQQSASVRWSLGGPLAVGAVILVLLIAHKSRKDASSWSVLAVRHFHVAVLACASLWRSAC